MNSAYLNYEGMYYFYSIKLFIMENSYKSKHFLIIIHSYRYQLDYQSHYVSLEEEGQVL